MQIKINRIEATAHLRMRTDEERFREHMRDFRAFQRKAPIMGNRSANEGANDAIKRAHLVAKELLAKGRKLPSAYAHEISLYGIGAKGFKLPFAKPPVVKQDREFLAAVKEEFAAAGFKIKSRFLKGTTVTPFVVDGVYPEPTPQPMILINPDKSIEVFRYKYPKEQRGTGSHGRKKVKIGTASNKTERKALIATLARIQVRESNAKEKANPKLVKAKKASSLQAQAEVKRLQDERDSLVKQYDLKIQKILDSQNPLKRK